MLHCRDRRHHSGAARPECAANDRSTPTWESVHRKVDRPSLGPVLAKHLPGVGCVSVLRGGAISPVRLLSAAGVSRRKRPRRGLVGEDVHGPRDGVDRVVNPHGQRPSVAKPMSGRRSRAPAGFGWIAPCHNAQFAPNSVPATGHRTRRNAADGRRCAVQFARKQAEHDDSQLVQGPVFVGTETQGVDSTTSIAQWWRYVPGANWRHRRARAATIDGKDEHPGRTVSYEDGSLRRGGKTAAHRGGVEFAGRRPRAGRPTHGARSLAGGAQANTMEPRHAALARVDNARRRRGRGLRARTFPQGYGLYDSRQKKKMLGSGWPTVPLGFTSRSSRPRVWSTPARPADSYDPRIVPLPAARATARHRAAVHFAATWNYGTATARARAAETIPYNPYVAYRLSAW